MAYPPRPADPYPSAPTRTRVDQGRLWAGGIASAVVIVLLVAVLTWIVHELLDIPDLRPLADERGLVDEDVRVDLVAAFAITLVATLVLDLLLLTTPTPLRLFHWLIGLGTVVATLAPLARVGTTESSVARAIGSAVVGITMSSLLSGVARRSVRLTREG